jgi:hypothetical protein
VILAAGITAAIPLIPTNMFVGRVLPFHCTTEQGDKPLPITISATGGPVSVSTAAFVGEIELMTGAGRVVPVGSAVTENFRELEFVAGLLPDTAMATAAAPVPRKAVSVAVIAAVSCVALTRVVGRGEPFQLMTSPSSKSVPFTVRVSPVGLQYGVLFAEVVDAESDVMVGRTIWNEIGVDGFALDAGLATATCAVPTEAISAAGTVAISWAGFSWVGPKYVVAKSVVTLPFVHCTTEHGRRFVPLTVKEKAAAPAVARVCEMETFVGVGGDEVEIVKGEGFERKPELDTVIEIGDALAKAISEAGMAAVSCVELTNVVTSADVVARADCVAGTVHSTTEPFTKFVPVTVRMTPGGLHAGVEGREVMEDDKDVTVGAAIVKGNCEEAIVPGLTSWMCVVPGFARSAAGTVATSAAGMAGEVSVGATAGT